MNIPKIGSTLGDMEAASRPDKLLTDPFHMFSSRWRNSLAVAIMALGMVAAIVVSMGFLVTISRVATDAWQPGMLLHGWGLAMWAPTPLLAVIGSFADRHGW